MPDMDKIQAMSIYLAPNKWRYMEVYFSSLQWNI